MRGLIVKDMLIMRKNLRTYAVFMGFYLIMSALDLFSISFTTAIIQIIVMMLPMAAVGLSQLTARAEGWLRRRGVLKEGSK